MASSDLHTLIDSEKRIGTVTKVTALTVDLNLPRGLAAAGRRGVSRGAVGDFVFIDCDRVVILGRIFEVQVPERARSILEHQFEREPEVEPIGRVYLLATIHKTDHRLVRGIEISPRIGDGVFEVTGSTLTNAIQNALFGSLNVTPKSRKIAISIGRISGIYDMNISVPPENLFGRHCGIFGATGGGKSWTLAKLVSEVTRLNGKAILIDPTGEFRKKFQEAEEWEFNSKEDDLKPLHFPVEMMTVSSLFALLRPTGQSQAPTLRDAVRSLKLVRAVSKDTNRQGSISSDGSTVYTLTSGEICVGSNGTLLKSGKSIPAYREAVREYSDAINSETCDFDINPLADQVANECIWQTSRYNDVVFGDKNDNTLSHCNTLMLRINDMLNSRELSGLFNNEFDSFCDILDAFLDNDRKRLLSISFRNVSFGHNAREVLLEVIGEYLLRVAREDKFKECPVICFLDEAHQFLGRTVGNDDMAIRLEAFGLIAKEGRKYGLTVVLSTQRPRDIPQDVLSQIGTQIVHRLTNESDREMVVRSCGELDKSAAEFIPSLGQGEAIILGPDLPAPLPVKIDPLDVDSQPASMGPNYQSAWIRSD